MKALMATIFLVGCGATMPLPSGGQDGGPQPGADLAQQPANDDLSGPAPSFFGTYTCTASQSQTCQGGTGSGTYDISAGICPMTIAQGAGASDVVATHHDGAVDQYTITDANDASLTAPETYPDFANPFGPGTIHAFTVESGTMMLATSTLAITQSGSFDWQYGVDHTCTYTRTFTGTVSR